MPTTEDIKTWRGHDALGSDGDKLGKIEDIYLDEQTGKPEWMAVKTGLFGGRVSFVPLAQARLDGDAVTVPYDKATIKDAPHAEADGQLSQPEEADLYRHYGLDYGEARSDSGRFGTWGQIRLPALRDSERSAAPSPCGRGSSGFSMCAITSADRSACSAAEATSWAGSSRSRAR
jgi:sporulation protein YlmC with PRC-barrel domain